MLTLLSPILGLGRFMRRARRCQDGTATIEYAFLAPMIILLAIGTFETMMFLSVKTLIDAGTREASRFGLTGEQVAGMSREARIRQIVEQKVSPLVDPAAVTVEVTAYNSFDELINAGDPDPGVDGAGLGQQVVVYDVTYLQPVITPFLQKITGVEHLMQHARVVVQNEPF